jgi:hypothetical protein
MKWLLRDTEQEFCKNVIGRVCATKWSIAAKMQIPGHSLWPNKLKCEQMGPRKLHFFCSTEVWTHGLVLSKRFITSATFPVLFFYQTESHIFLPRPASDHDPPTSAPRVTGITGVILPCQTCFLKQGVTNFFALADLKPWSSCSTSQVTGIPGVSWQT